MSWKHRNLLTKWLRAQVMLTDKSPSKSIHWLHHQEKPKKLMQCSTSRPNRRRLSMVLKGWAPSSVGESLPGLGRQEMDTQTESDLVSAVVSGGISSQTTLFPLSQPLNQWFSTLLTLQSFTYLFMYLFNTISLMDLWEIHIMNPT